MGGVRVDDHRRTIIHGAFGFFFRRTHNKQSGLRREGISRISGDLFWGSGLSGRAQGPR